MFKFDPIQIATGRKFEGAYNQISMNIIYKLFRLVLDESLEELIRTRGERLLLW